MSMLWKITVNILQSNFPLLLTAWNHDKLDPIHLCRMLIGDSLNNGTFMEIPKDDGAIFGSRCHISVAFAHLDIDDNISMAMKRSLQNQCVFAPNFDYPAIKLQTI